MPPTTRGEQYLDPATKTHINDDPAQYYDYALSYVILFQLHDHIAKNILKQDPHATNYYGNKEVGAFLADIMRPGASQDWRTVLKDKTGEDLSARAMVEYFPSGHSNVDYDNLYGYNWNQEMIAAPGLRDRISRANRISRESPNRTSPLSFTAPIRSASPS